jgi:hypothetical protein
MRGAGFNLNLRHTKVSLRKSQDNLDRFEVSAVGGLRFLKGVCPIRPKIAKAPQCGIYASLRQAFALQNQKKWANA